jgi:hypothetical protein
MTTANTNNIFRSPGRLVLNPTNLALAYPYGGKELGVCRDALFKPNVKTVGLIAEEFKTPVEVVYSGQEPIFTGVLRTWDNDLIGALFAGLGKQTDGSGNVGVIHNELVNPAGSALSSQACVLLFSPQALALKRHILMYCAIPCVDDSFEMRLSIAEEFGLPFFFQCLPDSQGYTHVIDLLANLNLAL